MSTHRLKLYIAKNIADDPGIIATKHVSLRERLLRLILGKRRQVTLVVPGDSVKQIDITEALDDDDPDDDLLALAKAVGVTREGGERV